MMRKSIVTVLVTAFMLLFGCSGLSTGGEKGYNTQVIRIDEGRNLSTCIQQIMHLNNILEKYLPDDVSVEWARLAGSPNMRDALVANEIDIAGFSVAALIPSVENGMPLVILSGATPNLVELYTTREDINSFNDILDTHKIVLAGKGSAAELAFSIRCKEVFGDPMKFANNIVVASEADQVMMIQGLDEYELYVTSFPQMQKMSAYEKAKEIGDLEETVVEHGVAGVLATTESFYKNNPVLIEAFRKASEEAVKYLTENTEEAAEQLAELYGVVPEDVVSALRKGPPELKVQHYDEIADMLLEMGILSKPAKKFSDLAHYNGIPKE